MSSPQPQSTHNQFGQLPEWDLSDLYPGVGSDALKADMAFLETETKAFEADFKGKLDGLAKEGGLVEAVRRFEKLDEVFGRLGSFAYLNYAQNTGDGDRVKFLGDTQDKITGLSTRILFFTLEINRIEDEVLDAAFEASADLAHYRPWFTELRKSRPYQLEDRVEELFHDKYVTGHAAWNRLFDETMASLKFEIDGETLGLEQTLNLLSDKHEDKRAAAFKGLSATLSANKKLFAHITNVMAKDKEISDRWRGYEDVADSRHLANSVERDVVDALEKAVRDAYPRLSHRYYQMKAKWFGKDKLDAWDRNAPLTTKPPRGFDWAQGRALVLDSFSDLGPEFAERAGTFFDRNWIDARPRAGKQSGAYAHPVTADRHPYVFLNWMGERRDVLTLAHELGHGVHQTLA
ncbi:MAG TPA: oligoendopeptidase F, partial [Brevundimonas sp.]|nr:oligoendopeptidase F [Brevundimonas sp.]